VRKHVGAAPGDLGGLRADLVAADYTSARLDRLWGVTASRALSRGELIPARRALEGSDDPAAALARLWMLGLAVSRERATSALPRGWEAALDHGLLALDNEGVRGTVDLRPHGEDPHEGWVVSGVGSMVTGGALTAEHVVGVGGASATLASWTPRPRVQRALDVGTGSGVQLLSLAGHTARRVATDTSPEALRLAGITAALSDVSVDLREGSWFDPVAGERFGLVVSNPPFVITPRSEGSRLTYRDGGGVGDEVLRTLIRDVGAHLAPGGVAQFLGNWEVASGSEWDDRPGAWVRESGLDALVVQRDLLDVAEYARTWVHDAGTHPGDPEGMRWYSESLADFERRRVTHVGLGIVTLQRPSETRTPWVHLADLRGPVQHPMGGHVLSQLRARSWLAMHTDEELLSVPWTVADDVTLETVARPGCVDPVFIRARQASGFGCARRLTALTAGVLGACDGELSARQLTVAVAALLEVDAGQAIADLANELRDWVAWGLVR